MAKSPDLTDHLSHHGKKSLKQRVPTAN